MFGKPADHPEQPTGPEHMNDLKEKLRTIDDLVRDKLKLNNNRTKLVMFGCTNPSGTKRLSSKCNNAGKDYTEY